jgi:hypothetical protein
MSRIQQQQRRNRRIDAAGQGNDDAPQGRQPAAARGTSPPGVTWFSMSSG